MRRNILTLFLLLFVVVSAVSAAEFLQNSECHVPAGEVIEDNLFVLCRNLVIEGEVRGHLIGVAVTATISGTMRDNVYLAAGQLDVTGNLQGDLHFAGVTLNIRSGTVFDESDLVSLALNTDLHSDVQLPGSIVGLGYQLLINGTVDRQVDFWGSLLRINGHVKGNITASVGDVNATGTASQIETLLLPFNFDVDLLDPGLVVTENGKVDGVLTYTSLSAAQINGQMNETPVYTPVEPAPTLIDLVEEEDPGGALRNYLGQVTREFTSLVVIGLLFILFVPQTLRQPMSALKRQPLSSLGIGILSFVISFPVVLIVVLLSLVLLLILGLLRLDGLLVVIGVLLGIVNLGGTSIFYFIAIFISRLVLALMVGRLFSTMILKTPSTTFAWVLSLTIGVALLSVFTSLPIVGWVINAMALFLGLGAILLTFMSVIRQTRETTTPSPVYYGADTVVYSPPVLEDYPQVRGTDNLPEGFKWWDD